MTKRNRFLSMALAAAFFVQPVLASAQECASEVQQAEEQARQLYINGMSGLANNSFSSRPGTFSSMACLDKFMQGGMDIFFRPPQLNDLLGQVLNFACQQAQQALSGAGGGGGTNLQSLIGSMSGGLNVLGAGGGAQTVNLSQVLGTAASAASQGNSIRNLFGQ